MVYAKTPRYTLIAVIPGRSPYIYLPPAADSEQKLSSSYCASFPPTPDPTRGSFFSFSSLLLASFLRGGSTHVRPRDGFSLFATAVLHRRRLPVGGTPGGYLFGGRGRRLVLYDREIVFRSGICGSCYSAGVWRFFADGCLRFSSGEFRGCFCWFLWEPESVVLLGNLNSGVLDCLLLFEKPR